MLKSFHWSFFILFLYFFLKNISRQFQRQYAGTKLHPSDDWNFWNTRAHFSLKSLQMLEWYLYSCNESNARSAMACVYFSAKNGLFWIAATNIAGIILRAMEQLHCKLEEWYWRVLQSKGMIVTVCYLNSCLSILCLDTYCMSKYLNSDKLIFLPVIGRMKFSSW